MSKNLYLTDDQYLCLLAKIVEAVEQEDFIPSCDDDTTIGSKHTGSNCGLCNDDFATLETAMFPDQFESGRKSMKYRQDHQLCPFDKRTLDDNLFNGCFYTCCLFHDGFLPKGPGTKVDKLRSLARRRLRDMTLHLKGEI